MCLGREDTNTTSSLDLLLGLLTEELGLDDNGNLGEGTLAENLEVTSTCNIDNRGLTVLAVGVSLAGLLRNKRPELVDVHDGNVVLVLLVVEVTHTNLTKVTRVILVHQDTVVVHTTGVTTTSSVLTVLTYTQLNNIRHQIQAQPTVTSETRSTKERRFALRSKE